MGLIWLKLKEKTYSKCFKTLSNATFCRCYSKVIPTLGPIISGTISDKDKPYVLQKEVVNAIKLRHKLRTNLHEKSKTWGSFLQMLFTMPKYGSTPPAPGGLLTYVLWWTNIKKIYFNNNTFEQSFVNKNIKIFLLEKKKIERFILLQI